MQEFSDMSHLEKNNRFIIETIKKHNKDWMRLFCGYEGDGKTLLACQNALQFNPDFDVKTQAIYTLGQLIDFQDTFEDNPGRVAFLDEAVLQLLGEESNTKDAKNSKKLFVTHRDRGHIYLLCSPSPWLMTPYIREWRVRDCVIVYTDWMSRSLARRYSYYSKHEYAGFITSIKAKKQIVVPYDFVKRYKPAFDDPFPMVTDEKVLEIYNEMSVKKKEAQRELRAEIRGDMEGNNQETDGAADHIANTRSFRDRCIHRMLDNGYKTKDAAAIFGISQRQVNNIKLEGSNKID